MNNFYCCNKKAIVNKNVCCSCYEYQECITRELNTAPQIITLAVLTVAVAALVGIIVLIVRGLNA